MLGGSSEGVGEGAARIKLGVGIDVVDGVGSGERLAQEVEVKRAGDNMDHGA